MKFGYKRRNRSHTKISCTFNNRSFCIMKFTVVIFVACTVLTYAVLINADARCGKNAGPSECGAVCEPTCTNPRPEICKAYCIPNGCQCNDGFLRDVKTGECVRPHRCSERPQ